MKFNKILIKNVPLIIIVILVIIIIILFPFKINYSYSIENFENSEPVQIDNELAPENKKKEIKGNYLYPIKGLSSICAKENLKPSFMPKACYVDGILNSYANCKCEDKYGNCKICYETIIKDTKNSSVVYDAKNF
jgi:hypothetical protein